MSSIFPENNSEKEGERSEEMQNRTRKVSGVSGAQNLHKLPLPKMSENWDEPRVTQGPEGQRRG